MIVSAHGPGIGSKFACWTTGWDFPAGWTLENSGGLGLSVTRQRIAGLHPDGESYFARGYLLRYCRGTWAWQKPSLQSACCSACSICPW